MPALRLAPLRPLLVTDARVSRPSGAPGRPGRWPWPPEKRGRRWIDVLEACQLLGACCVGIRRGHQSGRSAPTLNTLSCSVTSTEPACAMALQETAARRFCDCQHVRRPPRLAVMLGLRHGGRELLRGLQGRSRIGPCDQLHHTNLLLKRPSCPGVRPGRWPVWNIVMYTCISAFRFISHYLALYIGFHSSGHIHYLPTSHLSTSGAALE